MICHTVFPPYQNSLKVSKVDFSWSHDRKYFETKKFWLEKFKYIWLNFWGSFRIFRFRLLFFPVENIMRNLISTSIQLSFNPFNWFLHIFFNFNGNVKIFESLFFWKEIFFLDKNFHKKKRIPQIQKDKEIFLVCDI